MSQHRTIIFTLITIVLILGVSYFGLRVYIETEEKKLKAKAMAENILEGEEFHPKIIKVDYSAKIADGSPLVFGGSHTPPIEHQSAWEDIEDTGITLIRKDLYVEFTLPREITIEEYKRNINNVQDIKNWDSKTISNLQNTFKEAKEHNIKTIGIMGYAPKWLTHNGSPFGVPKDWEVFKDIVKKVYTIYRDELDYIEVWNEPDHSTFLVIEGSNYSKEQAYENIYITVSNAIREVDNEINDGKKVKIIAGVESNARISNVMNYFVNESVLNIKPDVISFHTYDSFLESLSIYRNHASKLGNPKIFITEWNYETRNPTDKLYKTGDKAMIFTSNRLIDFMKNGIAGANYFSILPVNTNNRGTNENTMGFYNWINNKAELLPQANAWRILSKSLSLGKGNNIIVEATESEDVNTLGFINSEEIYGGAFVNNTLNSELVEFHLENTKISKRAKIDIFLASNSSNGAEVVTTRSVYVENNKLKFRFIIPQGSVLGIQIYDDKQWYDLFDPIIRLNKAKSEISPV